MDDDPIEVVLLSEIGSEVSSGCEFVGHATMRDFIEAGPAKYPLVFLDRRIPPYNDYSETLPQLTEAGFNGRVVLMTAYDPGLEFDDYPFDIQGPIDKLKLLDPETLGPILDAVSPVR
ncbi:hypothetical protein [Maricaulis sp.]|uniref:hypothetical protein n=1 Tax=Maricaulis sp. TaxID=1486257 RepID=UPI0026111165|nr:hypothetical protein [Maricaulis sp.]